MGLRQDFLNVILTDLPTPTSTIDRSSARFDQLMGGKTGPGQWVRYAQNYGTSCAVTVTGWLLDAHAPPDMLNAPAPGGGGFVPGAHFARLMDGAKRRGWWKTPASGQVPDVRPGDVYFIQHGPGTEHTGAIVSVTPSADGSSLSVETADGGQISSSASSGPDIKRQVRTFTKGGGYKADYSTGTIIGWIALGGDEPLTPPSTPPDAPDSQPPDTEPAPAGPGGAPVAPAGTGGASPTVPAGTGGAPASSDGTEGSPTTSPAPGPFATPRSSAPATDHTALAMLALGVGILFAGASWYAYGRPPGAGRGLQALSTWTTNGDTILKLSGDLRDWADHTREIREVLDDVTGGRVIVDLSRVTFLGDEGMRLLFGIYRLAPWGTEVVYRAGPWRRTLELLGRGALTVEPASYEPWTPVEVELEDVGPLSRAFDRTD